jgi:hypothetical protein
VTSRDETNSAQIQISTNQEFTAHHELFWVTTMEFCFSPTPELSSSSTSPGKTKTDTFRQGTEVLTQETLSPRNALPSAGPSQLRRAPTTTDWGEVEVEWYKKLLAASETAEQRAVVRAHFHLLAGDLAKTKPRTATASFQPKHIFKQSLSPAVGLKRERSIPLNNVVAASGLKKRKLRVVDGDHSIVLGKDENPDDLIFVDDEPRDHTGRKRKRVVKQTDSFVLGIGETIDNLVFVDEIPHRLSDKQYIVENPFTTGGY